MATLVPFYRDKLVTDSTIIADITTAAFHICGDWRSPMDGYEDLNMEDIQFRVKEDNGYILATVSTMALLSTLSYIRETESLRFISF